MTLPGIKRDLDAVDRAGHLNIGEQQVEAIRTVDQADGLSAILSLDHLETLVVQHFCRRKAN